MNVECKGLLFDMDGVLISSIASVNRCWRQWTKHYGIPGWETYTIPHGVRARDIMKSLRPDFTPAQSDEGLRFIEDLEIADTADLKVLDGVRELLESLPPERWTIVTSATRRLLLGRLKAAGLPYPEAFIAGEDVTNGKPHPEPYMRGAELLGLASADCIVFEDAPSGAGSGKAAGSRVLGVLGTHKGEELYAAGAEWVVGTLASLKVTVSPESLKLEFPVVSSA